jgi:TetR/AcrR family transcriptional repressor of bet genes
MPRVVDHEQRRDQVAEVAERVIAAHGLETGVRDVARAGGWSTSVVTHYFADKRELLEYTLRRTIERAVVRIEVRVAAGQSRLLATLEENLPLDRRRQNQCRIFIAFWGRAVHDPTLGEHQRRRHERFRSSLVDALAQVVPLRGHRLNLDLEARRLFSLIDGIAVQALFEPAEWPAQLQIELVNRHLGELGLPDRIAPLPRRRVRAAS